MDTNQLKVDPELSQSNEPRSGLVRFVKDVFETLLLALVLFLGINVISARIRVDGASMQPTLSSGEYVVVNRLSYRFGTPHHGDIIVFHFPHDPSQEYIKRIIGLPGDTVEAKNGTVLVNDQPLDESYVKVKTDYVGTWKVPEGQLFVLGDNRNNSSDSHDWGTVPIDYVVGKAILVYWPPPAWGLLEHISTANAAH